MQEDLLSIPAFPAPTTYSPLISPRMQKGFEAGQARTSDLSVELFRNSIGTPRNDLPKLPASEMMRDLFYEIPHGYNNIGTASSRCSFGSVKEEALEGKKLALVIEEIETPDNVPMSGFMDEDSLCFRISGGVVPQMEVPLEPVTEMEDTDDSKGTNRKVSLEQMSEEPFEIVIAEEVPAAQTQAKKCCSCKKSMCLKLYCECFAAGQYCEGCNCVECHNLAEYEKERLAAIAQIARKNPAGLKRRIALSDEAEKPVSGTGCNCTKSGCRKNYCECFKMGVVCGPLCNCEGCRNLKPRKARGKGKRQ